MKNKKKKKKVVKIHRRVKQSSPPISRFNVRDIHYMGSSGVNRDNANFGRDNSNSSCGLRGKHCTFKATLCVSMDAAACICPHGDICHTKYSQSRREMLGSFIGLLDPA